MDKIYISKILTSFERLIRANEEFLLLMKKNVNVYFYSHFFPCRPETLKIYSPKNTAGNDLCLGTPADLLLRNNITLTLSFQLFPIDIFILTGKHDK